MWRLTVGMVLLFASAVLPALADSFYSEATYSALVSDKRAIRIGDSVTVLVVEASSAQSVSDTSLDRNLGVSAGLNLTNDSEAGDLALEMNRESAGATNRKGAMRAQLSATVLKEDQIGRFYVEGKQTILVNGENQEITLKGWLRPQDIEANNVTLSTRLADAEITYVGMGDPGDTNEPGWIHWFFAKIGLI